MPKRSPLPLQLGSSFTIAAARSAGVGTSRLRARDLHRSFHGARTLAPAVELLERAHALAPLLGPAQRFSHLTAAGLHGMRMPQGRSSTSLHVTGVRVSRAVRRPGVIGHVTAIPAAVLRIGDLPVSTAVDAWCECAELLPVDDLIVMADGLLARRSPAASLDELVSAAAARAGRRGSARLRRALPQVRAGTDSARETLLRLLVVRAGLPEPIVNAELTRGGRVIAHGDLVWPAERVVLEYDGRHHAESREQFAIDIRRLDDIAAAGYRVIRVDRRMMASRAALIGRIREALAARQTTRMVT